MALACCVSTEHRGVVCIIVTNVSLSSGLSHPDVRRGRVKRGRHATNTANRRHESGDIERGPIVQDMAHDLA